MHQITKWLLIGVLALTHAVYVVPTSFAARQRSTHSGFQSAINATGWVDDGTTVRLQTSTDNVSIGADTEPNSEKLQVTGSTRTTGEFIEGTGSTTGGVFGLTAVTKTSSFTLDNSNSVFFCDTTSGNVTATLVALSGATNRVYYLKKIDSSGNTCTLDGNASETIDDGLTAVLTAQYESITVIPGSSQWFII